MREYTVVYLSDAAEELASIWEESAEKSAVARAANQADRILAVAPRDQSVFLGEDLWRLEVKPLRFYFAIREADRLVEVSNLVRVVE